MKRGIIIMELIALAILASVHVGAQTDYLDNSFGVNGKVITDFGGSVVTGAAQIMPDGKILVAGQYYNSGQTGLALIRYLPNGELDESYGVEGVKINLLGEYDFFTSTIDLDPMLIQSDGKTVVNVMEMETAYDSFRLLRYQHEGDLDLSFGNNGSIVYDFGSFGSCNTIIQQQDGKLLVGGFKYTVEANNQAILKRFMPDGTIDASFGIEGQVIPFGASVSWVTALAVQGDGKILAAGNKVLSRFNNDGTLDTSFAEDFITANPEVVFNDVAIQPDGKIVAIGNLNGFWEFCDYFSIIRLRQDGTLDDQFGTNGMVLVDSLGSVTIEDLLILPDGKLMIVCSESNNIDNRLLVYKYQSDGNIDITFGNNGLLTIPAYHQPMDYELISLSSGDILLAGSAAFSSHGVALAQLHTDGSFNEYFGVDGKVYTDFGWATAIADNVVVQPDQKILVRGGLVFARYLSDGTPDLSFGIGGIARTLYGLDRMALQEDGKILLSGTSFAADGQTGGFALARFNQNGTEDISFGTNGLAEMFFDNSHASSYGIGIQSDGKLLVGGLVRDNRYKFGLARFLSNGMPDLTFGENGWGIADFGEDINPSSAAMAMQPDDKVLLAGKVDGQIAIARFLTSGELDPSFGLEGKVLTPWTGFTLEARSIALQPDGKIVVSAKLGYYDKTAVIRYLPNGSLDPSFGAGGKFSYQPLGRINIHSAYILSEGKIALAGRYSLYDSTWLAVLLLNSNGTLDTTIGMNGLVLTAINPYESSIYSSTVQSDDKIILVGSHIGDFLVIRYNNAFVTGVQNILDAEVRSLQVLPNPAAETTRIEGNFPTGSHITVSDAKGRLVYTERLVSSKNQVVFQVHNWQQGLYMIQVREPNGQLWFGRLVVVR